MKHEVHLAIEHIKALIKSGQEYNITAVAKTYGVSRVGLSKALKREGVGKPTEPT